MMKLLLLLISVIQILPSGWADHCDPRSLPDPRTLRYDAVTVLISGYSELRIPLLSSLAAAYAAHPAVAAVLILWSNPSTSKSALTPLTSISRHVSLHRHGASSSSLNSRFLPRKAISTAAVAVADDDVEVDPDSLSFAFATWRDHNRGLVGFFARSHDLDLEARTWIYTVDHKKYSIMLTKFVIMRTEYLFKYTCVIRLSEARRLVDKIRNCEDILMNFVAAMEGGGGGTPVLVQGKRIIDWGDPRNRGSVEGDNATSSSSSDVEMRRLGLSSRVDHWKVRGWCIREFHRMLGVMPLRYSYGRAVEGVQEQGLCHKNGKLLSCDHQQR